MRLKSNRVSVDGLHPKMLPILFRLDAWWRKPDNFGYELILTSVCDGRHSKQSQHYRGLAWDCRTWQRENSGTQVTGEKRDQLFRKLKRYLGKDFFVLDEGTHFHIDWRPHHD